MIASPSRQDDMLFRLKMLEEVEWWITRYSATKREYALEIAKMFGEVCAGLKKRIEGHDYSTDDKWI